MPDKPSPTDLISWYLSLNLRLLTWERKGQDPKKWKGPQGVAAKGWNAKDKIYDLSSYSPEKQNVGCFTGHEIEPGKFLADVDFDWDSPNVIKKKLLPATEFGFGRPSKFISHAFYTTDSQLPSNKSYAGLDGKVIVELYGGDSTEQTMIPPSLHSPGELLEFRSQGIPAHVSAEGLQIALRNYAICCLLFQHFGHRQLLHEPRMALSGFLLTEGLDAETVISIGQIICANTGNDPAGDDMPRVVQTTVSKLKSGERVFGAGSLAKVFGDEGSKLVGLIKRWIGNSEFQINEKGKIYADSQDNIRLALDKLGYAFTFNQFSGKTFAQNGGPQVLYNDSVAVPLWLKIDTEFRFRPSREFFETVVKDLSWKNQSHPVTEYLNGLKWDGKPRIDRWLIEYGGAHDNPYVRAVGSLVLLAAVRRVRQPGCKFDEMLILESAKQGMKKSSALRALCPKDDWFSDDLPLGADAKQIIERTGGKWIIEASELHGSRQREAEHLKSFLSRQCDGPVRLAYERLSTEVPRQFIIIGTTNSLTGYLKDFSGSRRFWPVRIERMINAEQIAEDRDQLWAEAAYREAEGASIRLAEDLWALASEQQEMRRLDDPWEEALKDAEISLDAPYIEASLIWDALQMFAVNQRNNQHANRISEIMQRFGYHEKRKIYIRDEGEMRRAICWVRPDFQEARDIFGNPE